MRFLVSLACALSVTPLNVANAEPVIPTALYNPANGAIFFDHLQPIVDSGDGLLIVSSYRGNINEEILDRGEVKPLPISALGPTGPFSYDENRVIWNLDGIYDSPGDEPMFAGNIVVPGTPYQDLFFQSFAGPISLGFENVIPIPEPSTALLLFLALLVCGGNRLLSAAPAIR